MISFARGITIVEMRLLSTPSLWDAMALASSADGRSRRKDRKLGFSDQRGRHSNQVEVWKRRRKRKPGRPVPAIRPKKPRAEQRAEARAWLAARRK